MTTLESTLAKQLDEKEKLLTLKERESRIQAEKIRLMEQRIAWLEQKLFGTGKSEKLDTAQLQLQLSALEEAQQEQAEAQKQLVSYERAKKRKPRISREEAFEHLPVEETIEVIPDEVKAEPEKYKEIGTRALDEVHVRPTRLYKVRTVYKKYKRLDDASQPPVIAPAKPRFLEGSYASIALVVYIIIDKYKYHNPLYRQEDKFKQIGTRISCQTMCGWVAQAAWWLKPLYDYLGEYLKTLRYLQADETPIEYLDPGSKKGKTGQGQLWTFGHPHAEVIYLWRLNRKHKNATDFLTGYQGVLQSDGYQAYASAAKQLEGITLVCCLAHIRRYFHEALEERPLLASFILRLISYAYRNEDQWKAQKLPAEQIAHLRQRDTALNLSMIKRVLEHYKNKALPKSRFGKAIQYTQNMWPLLQELLKHGEVYLDNNHQENAMRPTKLGSKNYLFFGSAEAGHNSAMLYTFIVSCQRIGIDPSAYLNDTLEKLVSKTHNKKELHTLLPSQWKIINENDDKEQK